MSDLPILALDVDGVICPLDNDRHEIEGDVDFRLVDGVPLRLFRTALEAVSELKPLYELVWATGWGERANEFLAPGLGIQRLGSVEFESFGSKRSADWKIEAIEEFAGSRRLAWIDDSHTSRTHRWARRRQSNGPDTLLVATTPWIGITGEHVRELVCWAEAGS